MYYLVFFRSVILLLCLSIFCGISTRSVQAAQKVQWFLIDVIPLHTSDYTGYSDEIGQYFSGQIPKFTHSTQVAPLARILDDAKNGLDLCVPFMLKTEEREKNFLFSAPLLLLPGFRIHVRKGSAIEAMAQDGAISLELLLSQNDIKYASRKNRTYGANIDRLLKKYSGEDVAKINLPPSKAIELLYNERIDFFIEYPFLTNWIAQNNTAGRCFTALKILEQNANITAYIGCTKNAAGENAIAAINAVIRTQKRSPEYKTVFMAPAAGTDSVGAQEFEELYKLFLKEK